MCSGLNQGLSRISRCSPAASQVIPNSGLQMRSQWASSPGWKVRSPYPGATVTSGTCSRSSAIICNWAGVAISATVTGCPRSSDSCAAAISATVRAPETTSTRVLRPYWIASSRLLSSSRMGWPSVAVSGMVAQLFCPSAIPSRYSRASGRWLSVRMLPWEP